MHANLSLPLADRQGLKAMRDMKEQLLSPPLCGRGSWICRLYSGSYLGALNGRVSHFEVSEHQKRYIGDGDRVVVRRLIYRSLGGMVRDVRQDQRL